MLYFIYSTLIK